MKNLAIRKIADNDFPAWDNYVDNHDDGSFFHLTGWQHVISKVFGHRHHYLLAENDDQLVGILPLFEQKKCNLVKKHDKKDPKSGNFEKMQGSLVF